MPVSRCIPISFVVADMWNRWDRWVRIEAEATLIKPPLLHDLAITLSPFQEWCVYLALVRGGLTVFGNRILFEGSLFDGCCSVDDVYRHCAPPNS